MFSSGLYAIADADHTPDVVTWGETLLRAGVRTLQLRAKCWRRSQIADAARQLVSVANHHDAVFILNDHPVLAAEVGAHGVHLGQTDMSPSEARAIVGATSIIGLSTHTIDQVRRTRSGATEADYLGFGPVFSTSSKVGAGSPRGPGLLAEAVRVADLPVVAIGGISVRHLPDVIDAGPHGWAVIRALTQGADPVEAIRAMSDTP